jgi:hypothetical protein
LDQIRDKITRKSKFWGQLRAKLKKFRIKDLFIKGVWIWGPNSTKNKGEIEEIINLKVN